MFYNSEKWVQVATGNSESNFMIDDELFEIFKKDVKL
jgi:hypothetical protein